MDVDRLRSARTDIAGSTMMVILNETPRAGQNRVQVSEIGLGTAELGLDYGIAAAGEMLRPSEREAAELLHFALDSGINLIDTAGAYGSSERIIGQALPGRRSEVFLVSKVRPGSVEQVRQSIEESLRQLCTSVLDTVMIHAGATDVELHEETLSALERLRKEGMVRFLGASAYGPEAAVAAIKSGRLECLEVAYSLIDRRPKAELFDAARDANMRIIVRSVLLKGALAARYQRLPLRLSQLKAAVEMLARISGLIETLPQLAYRYVLQHEPPHVALAGTGSRSELTRCIEYAREGPLASSVVDLVSKVPRIDDWMLNPGNWPEG